MSPLDRFDRFLGRVSRVGLWVSALIAIAIVGVVSLEVVLRTFFGTTLFVVEEFVGYLMAAFTMFGLAHALRSDNILRVEVVFGRLGPRAQARCILLCHAVSLVFMVILEHQLIRLVYTSHRREIVSVTLMSFPVWIPQSLIALGGALLLVSLANETLQHARRPGRRWELRDAEQSGGGRHYVGH